VVLVTALDEAADRIAGLEAGADDFLTKPVDDIALITRVKSLVRLKMVTDDLMMRAATSARLGLEEAFDPATIAGTGGRVLLVDDTDSTAAAMQRALGGDYTIDRETELQEALFRAAEGDYDLAVVSLALASMDALRLCAQLRSIERTRSLPILLTVDPGDGARLIRGLELGVNDYLMRPFDRNEMRARVKSQVRRKRFSDRLRDKVQMSMELAVLDELTGLRNRRYLDRHLASLVDQAREQQRPLSVLMLDIDHFKAINDTYGHLAGDQVLREFARRVAETVRGVDLACRMGGEEFVVVMPGTDGAVALKVAERLRKVIADVPFAVPDRGQTIAVTVSVGMAMMAPEADTPQTLLKRADEALYRAKRDGRNRVVAAAA
jgi:two-component system cell cycle response regulator